jgi:hypothetical protein
VHTDPDAYQPHRPVDRAVPGVAVAEDVAQVGVGGVLATPGGPEDALRTRSTRSSSSPLARASIRHHDCGVDAVPGQLVVFPSA